MAHPIDAGKDHPIKRGELAQRRIQGDIVVSRGDNVDHRKNNGYRPEFLEAGHEFMCLRLRPRDQDALAAQGGERGNVV